MAFDNKGNYTPASGAETAAPGAVIRSLTWNNIFTDLAAALTTLGNLTYTQNARVISAPGAVTVAAADSLIEITVSVSVINLPASSLKLWPVRIAGNATGVFSTKNAVITPNGGQTISGLSTYTLNVEFQDVTLIPLSTGGWLLDQPRTHVQYIRVVAAGINFNSANTDTSVTLQLPPGISRYSFNIARINNASASISTATVGIFTGAGGTGQTVAANQAITVTATATDTNNNTMALTLTNANTMAYNDTTIFVRVGTAQGSAATADVVITIIPLT